MAYNDTLLIDGTDVYDLPGAFAVDFIDGLHAPGTTRGDDDVIPGADGELTAPGGLPVAKYMLTVSLWIVAATPPLLTAHLRAVGPLVTGTRGLVTLTRKFDNGAGFDTHTTPGRFATGLTPVNDTRTSTAANLELQFYVLRGLWFDGSSWVY